MWDTHIFTFSNIDISSYVKVKLQFAGCVNSQNRYVKLTDIQMTV